jgi:antibiotic biosynthesis monooxygenase (ABM) superfamily enzyme
MARRPVVTQRNPAPSLSSPRTAPSIHVRAALTWLAIFPLVAIGLTAIAPYTVGWDPVLRAFVPTLVLVPLAVSMVVPRLKRVSTIDISGASSTGVVRAARGAA